VKGRKVGDENSVSGGWIPTREKKRVKQCVRSRLLASAVGRLLLGRVLAVLLPVRAVSHLSCPLSLAPVVAFVRSSPAVAAGRLFSSLAGAGRQRDADPGKAGRLRWLPEGRFTCETVMLAEKLVPAIASGCPDSMFALGAGLRVSFLPVCPSAFS